MKTHNVSEKELKKFTDENPCTVLEMIILKKFIDFINKNDPLICDCDICENLRQKYKDI